MCGVLGLITEKDRKDLGEISCELLRMLEYRGYDSTGAIIQDSKNNITLKKDVGAPSVVSRELGIHKLTGKIFCGQVRWATFGIVTKENAQPHEVKCKTHIYGAHNGNITNCDRLKKWLIKEGHDIKSDNDGEMLVHTIEHFFAIELKKIDETNNKERILAFKNAIINANKSIIGSFASVVVDPISQTMICIKSGSSLYMGIGFDEKKGAFTIASSDLASVLTMTKILIPISAKEFAVYHAKNYKIYDIRNGKEVKKQPLRSKLKVEETRLKPPFKHFMEQEIFAQIKASEKLINLFTGNSKYISLIREIAEENPDLIKNIKHAFKLLANITDLSELKKRSKIFINSEELKKLKEQSIKKGVKKIKHERLDSSQGVFLQELNNLIKDNLYISLIDAIFFLDEVNDIDKRINHFVDRIVKAYEYGSSIYLIACGTSFHAGKSSTLFFDKIPGLNLFPVLPGEFRAQYSNSIRNKDVIIGISQSGETKDLIDIFDQVTQSDKDVTLISIVNNVNSSLALEKSELFIPLFCGPEIAVPATKSFLNQLLVLYILALRVAESFSTLGIKKVKKQSLKKYWKNLFKIPELIKKTIETTKDEIIKVSDFLYMEPSMHILATGMLGIAKEGALKIREVVLNHTEGFEGAEFKHGPNTILGINTIFGMKPLEAIFLKFSNAMSELIKTKKMNGEAVHRLFNATIKYVFEDIIPDDLPQTEKKLLKQLFKNYNFFESLYTNYPLLFITNSTERDVNLTISQINTHKIRGANVFIIAEENTYLREAITNIPPSKFKDIYKYGYIVLPETKDNLLPIFTSTVVLQLLALNMSIKKLKVLDNLNINNHGVHPDSPKNVSKSITVD